MSLNIFKNKHRVLSSTHTQCALLLGIFLLLVSPGIALARETPGGCGQLKGGNDYRPDRYKGSSTNYRSLLDVVEKYHFTPEVENLIRGSTGSVGGDLTYTLNAFPNHHRALMAMVALGEKEKTSQPFQSEYSVECWLQRAIAWGPDDNIVRMIYARYLVKLNRTSEAEQQLNVAARQTGDNPFTHNNIGLIYFNMKNYEKALFHAHQAYALGLTIPNLREQLKRVGKWSEPAQALPIEPAKNPQ